MNPAVRTQLKVNVCSLMAESRQIRKEVNRFKRTSPQKGAAPECQELIWHRRVQLRDESRAAQLCYGFVRGVPYRKMERTANHRTWKWRSILGRLSTKCRKFGLEWNEVEEWFSQSEVAVG